MVFLLLINNFCFDTFNPPKSEFLSIMEAAFVVELAFLNGTEKLKGLGVFFIMRY